MDQKKNHTDPTVADLPPSLREALTLLTVEQVCDLFSVKKEWVWEACRLEVIPHVKMRRQIRFRPRDIERWLEQQVSGGAVEHGV